MAALRAAGPISTVKRVITPSRTIRSIRDRTVARETSAAAARLADRQARILLQEGK